MGLASLASAPEYRGTRPCTFKRWLTTLSPEQQTLVREALYRTNDDPRYWTTPQLHAVLRDEGWTGSESTTGKHRKVGSCLQCR